MAGLCYKPDSSSVEGCLYRFLLELKHTLTLGAKDKLVYNRKPILNFSRAAFDKLSSVMEQVGEDHYTLRDVHDLDPVLGEGYAALNL